MKTTIANKKERDTRLVATQEGSFLRVGELSTYGVEWSDCSRATALGGMAYFGHYLNANGLFDDLVERCPLTYTSNNAPGKRRVLGTVVSGILNGARRYAHLSHQHGDKLCSDVLGIKTALHRKIAFGEGYGRGLKRIGRHGTRG